MILYINACVRKESRTDRLARALLEKLGSFEELKLDELELRPLSEEALEYRSRLIASGNFDDRIFRLSKQFASADTIVIAAPYWDGSFPSSLKVYLENIYCTGIVSEYGPDGMPRGLCKAGKLYYVVTSGGPYNPAYSYEFFKDIAVNMFGIKEAELISLDMLDIFGNNPEKMLSDKIAEVVRDYQK